MGKTAHTDDILAEDGGSPLSADNAFNISERKTIAKIDLRILPVLTVLYVFAFIDRVNIGNALLFNLQEDTGLSSAQYNICITTFFATYITFEIPANLLMKKVKPHIFLSSCMFCFGLLLIIQGCCQNFGGLVTVRFFLGIVEAGVFPGCFYVISMWYKRAESQKRFSFFFNATSLAGAFGGLLASAIGNLDGVYGHHGWRWIFWVEGGVTCALAFFAFFLVTDFPEETKWLKGSERAWVIARLAEDQGTSDLNEHITIKAVFEALKDWKLYPAGFMYLGPGVSGYGLAYFIPTIVSTYGYGPVHSQLLSVPPWAAVFVLSMIIAYFSDRLRHRFSFYLFGHMLALAGSLTLFNLHYNRQAQYAAVCLYLMGAFCCLPLAACWNVMNLRGHANRAVGTAWQVGFGNCAGFVAAWSFPADDSPEYRLGYSLGIGFLCLSLVMSIVYWSLCLHENRRRKAEGLPLLFL